MLDEEYWEGLRRGEVLLTRCVGCTQWLWNEQYRCPECGSWDQEWAPVEPEGTVFTWTRVWYVSETVQAYKNDVPFVVIRAEVAGPGGPLLTGPLQGSESGLRCGARVRGSIEPPSEKTLGYARLCWALV